MRYISCVFILAFCCDARHVPEDGIYSVVDNMPEYEAGMTAFEIHISSYIDTIENPIKGAVFVSFVVTEDGSLKDVKVVKSINDQQDKMALNAVKNAPLPWKPGVDQGKNVSVKMVYPVNFEK